MYQHFGTMCLLLTLIVAVQLICELKTFLFVRAYTYQRLLRERSFKRHFTNVYVFIYHRHLNIHTN